MTENSPTVSVTDAAGLIAAVPLLLGFRPTESLVVLSVRNRRLGPVMRVDLPPPTDVVPIGSYLVEQSCRHGDAVAVLAFSGSPDARSAVATVLDLMLVAGLSVIDALVVDGDTASFLPDPRGRLTPPIGVPNADDPFVTELAAAAAIAGRAVLPSRSALAESIRPPRASNLRRARQQMKAARLQLGDAADRQTLIDRSVGVIDRALDQIAGQRSVGPATAATLCLVVQDVIVRDLFIAQVVTDRQSGWLPLLISAVTQVPADESEDLTVVLASAAYRCGDGALAQVAVDRCLQTRPDHRMAWLLRELMTAGLPPTALDSLGDLLDEDPDEQLEWFDDDDDLSSDTDTAVG
jgi:hypothetical protein